MANVTASMVKELRDKTGAGMMDCKMALTETGGELEQAVDWLRKKGLSKAAKKADRIAADGLIGVAISGTTGALVEVRELAGREGALGRALAILLRGPDRHRLQALERRDALVGADLGAGVDVDASAAMRQFRHHPRDDRNLQLV